MGEPQKRRERGSQQIYRKGIDTATGKARYFARFTVDGKRHHVRLDATGLADAREEVVERIKAAKQGRPYREAPVPPEAPAMTVRQLVERFRDEAQNSRVWDVERYRRVMYSALKVHLLPYLGDHAAETVRRVDVAKWRDDLQEAKKSPTQILRGMAAASKMWNWALEIGIIDGVNPTANVRKPSAGQSLDTYDDSEIARLLATAAEKFPDLHPVVAAAYYSGCRRGELAALTWGDVDFEGDRIVVTKSWTRAARKSGKPLVVAMHPHLRAILAPLAPTEPGSHARLVFPDPVDGLMRRKHDAKNGVWRVRDLVTEAKVRRFKMPWHAIRHSHATALAAGGAGLLDIQLALGQSSLEMARRYTARAGEQVRAHVSKLPAIGPVGPTGVTPITAGLQSPQRTPLGQEALQADSETRENSNDSAEPMPGFEPGTYGLRKQY